MTDRDSPPARDAPSAPGDAGVAAPVPPLASWPTIDLGGGEPAPAGDHGSPAPQWRPITAVLALVGALGIGGIGGAIVALILGALLGVDVTGSSLPPGLEITATVVQEAAFVGVAVYCARLGGQRARPEQFGLRTTRVWQAIGLIIILYVSFLVVTDVWQTLFNNHTTEKLLDSLGANENALLLVASALVTCVIAPFSEEFLFRGYIFTALRNWRGPWPAAVLTGLVFGGVHVLSAPVIDLVPLAFLGFGLCLLYWRTRSLLPGIAAHSINNCLAFGALEGWPARDYLLLLGAALGLLGLIAVLMRSAGLIVSGTRAVVAAG